MPYGDEHLLPINKTMRQGAGDVSAGDTVTLEVERDDAPRVVQPPPELARLLVKNKAARASWDKLSPSHKREHASYITEAKQAETRARRALKTVALLLAGRPLK
jgi:uncharacterized protein YdeI (YjbR/CyaY-like superfamily)